MGVRLDNFRSPLVWVSHQSSGSAKCTRKLQGEGWRGHAKCCQSFGKRQEGLACFVLFPPLLLIRTLLGTRMSFCAQDRWGLAVVAGLESDATLILLLRSLVGQVPSPWASVSLICKRGNGGVGPSSTKVLKPMRDIPRGAGATPAPARSTKAGQDGILSAGRKSSRALGAADAQA